MSAAIALSFLALAACGDDGTATSEDGGSAPTGGNASDGGNGDGATASDGGNGAGSTDGGGPSDGGGGQLQPGGSVEDLFSADQYEEMFPYRDDPSCQGGLFTYEAFIEAATQFPAFATTGSMDDRKRELAAFLANISHETTGGWATAPGGPQAWGLCFKEEVGCGTGTCTGYCDPNNAQYPCAQGKTYHGRGPMQLSWNYNYGAAGEALDLPLLTEPERVANDGTVAFLTAFWFWMTEQAPKPSCHDVMTGAWEPSQQDMSAGRVPGFGMTINVINGGLECTQPTNAKVQDRIDFYLRYCEVLGVEPGMNLTCDTMQHY